MFKEAARQLRIAVAGLKILRLPLEVAACASDCAAVLAMVNPFEVASALRREDSSALLPCWPGSGSGVAGDMDGTKSGALPRCRAGAAAGR